MFVLLQYTANREVRSVDCFYASRELDLKNFCLGLFLEDISGFMGKYHAKLTQKQQRIDETTSQATVSGYSSP
ncbi:hypothetical protein DPMN_076242 [Dreissena polymorpha]|uniref:Uncharacterized protein n=1 Tax=Dreissena polymorpha TaxID=45954 RepID=A0A9D3YM06_DREPO|nr:hypothetical protein DPMN_076242 [Dreissena polymorpha]